MATLLHCKQYKEPNAFQSLFLMLVYPSLLSTKHLDLAKCRLVDFIKGSKSMVFFAKYLIFNSIVISNPLTSKIHIMN